MSEHEESTLPFGKHKGEPISSVPVKYLDWLIGQDWFCEKFEELAVEVQDYLETNREWQDM